MSSTAGSRPKAGAALLLWSPKTAGSICGAVSQNRSLSSRAAVSATSSGGASTEDRAGDWTTFAAARIGKIGVLLSINGAGKQYACFIAREYAMEFHYGNVRVAEERLLGLKEPRESETVKKTQSASSEPLSREGDTDETDDLFDQPAATS